MLYLKSFLQLPETCCSIPNFFDDDVLAVCKKLPGTDSLIREQMGRQKRYATTRLELGTCYLDCVFQLYGITAANRQGLDTNKLLRILEKETPTEPEATNVISSSFTQCINDLNTGALKIRSPTLYNCNTVPSALMLCIHRRFFQTCPPTRFANIQQCVQLRDYLIRCPVNI